MRALEPWTTGYATNPDDGVRSYYEVFGPGSEEGFEGSTLLLFPTWSLVHSRFWKMQVPYFARHGFRVITFDGRGNGKSDRPESGYATGDFAGDAIAVMEATGAQRVTLLTFSAGSRPGAQLASEYPDRIEQFVMIAPALQLQARARPNLDPFFNEPPDRESWNKYNAVHWRENYRDFVEWFVGEIFSEPHSTKPFDDFVRWAMETDGETLIATVPGFFTPRMAEFCASIRCPTLIVHGTDDRIIPFEDSTEIQAAIPESELFAIEGGGHATLARDPVKVNLIIHEFLTRQMNPEISREASDARA